MRRILTPPRRRPTELSALSNHFDTTVLATASGRRDALAFVQQALFAVSDQAGGRRIHRVSLAGWHALEDSPTWVAKIRGGTSLHTTVQELHSPSTGVLRNSREVFDAGSTRVTATKLSPVGTQIDVTTTDAPPGEATTTLTNVIAGPVSDGRNIVWVCEEWPTSSMSIVRAGDARPVVRSLPPGLLSSVTCDEVHWAAAWETPALAPRLIVADEPAELIKAAWESSGPSDPPWEVEYSSEGVVFARTTPRGPSRGVAVIVHGGPHSCWLPTFSPLTAMLVERGWTVVHPNVVGSTLGITFRENVRFGIDDAADLARVIGKVTEDGVPVVVIGWSYGAYLGARAATRDVRVDGLVSLCGFLDPKDILESEDTGVKRFLARAKPPDVGWHQISATSKLVIHGATDVRVPVDAMRRYARTSATQYVELEGEGHGIATDHGGALAYGALCRWLDDLDPWDSELPFSPT